MMSRSGNTVDRRGVPCGMSEAANPPPHPDVFRSTRDTLARVATHVVARARHHRTGRFGLRVTPGGFGSPEFGSDVERVRVSVAELVHETGPAGGASSRSIRIDGASLAELAAWLDLDLSADLSVGHDTPPLGDVHAPLTVDATAAQHLASWYDLVARALDRVLATVPAEASPSMIQLWPEHFDVAVDLAVRRGGVAEGSAADPSRVNLGGSPGDGFHDEPYLYVGPWEPGPWPTTGASGGGFWNAPFGAVMAANEVRSAANPVEAAERFLRDGLSHLAAST